LHHLMLVPSLACPASCAYCFGPHEGEPSMHRDTVEALVHWQQTSERTDPLEITFHGGEPLVPGAPYYRMALPLLREGLASHSVRFAMQSNLWLLDDELCELFREYSVSIGTSLDGPEDINDAQRGRGHFRRTMAAIERARTHGISVGCICTFTAQSASRVREVFDFFLREGPSLAVHAALPSLRYPQTHAWALSAEAHGQLLVDLLELYLENLARVRISTLDSMCRSVSAQRGGICTFGECLGGYLAVGPEGEIYPCQRFAGMPEYRLGSVHENPTRARLSSSLIWRTFQDRQDRIEEECGDCPHLAYCRGGCPYNALTANGGSFRHGLRDPHCVSYRRFFGHVTDRALDEVFSAENMDAVVSQADPGTGLLRRGRLLSIMREGPHPYETAAHARLVLAAVALAATGSSARATRGFERLGLVTNTQRTETGMEALHERLSAPVRGLNNLYLHVTLACPLHCSHCYAQAGPKRGGALSVEDVVCACREAADLGFRHAVITGGEPLVHPRRDALLDALAALREEVRPLLAVLRTSLALPLGDDLLRRVGHSTHELVVSLDGDRETHDARRGTGTYDLVVRNLRALMDVGCEADLSLATVLPLRLANGPPGDAVRALAAELGIRRTRFRPVLPLGRAIDSEPDVVPETLWGHLEPRDVVAYGFSPVASCGMGQNLYVEPDGGAYPCYAWHGEEWLLGHVNAGDALGGIIASPGFQSLRQHTVNTNLLCQWCPLRYLCGGACRAWNCQTEDRQTDLDAAPVDCSALHRRARSLLLSALEHLGVSHERWRSAGLPLPERPPLVE
jgi:uncharacterized protein